MKNDYVCSANSRSVTLLWSLLTRPCLWGRIKIASPAAPWSLLTRILCRVVLEALRCILNVPGHLAYEQGLQLSIVRMRAVPCGEKRPDRCNFHMHCHHSILGVLLIAVACKRSRMISCLSAIFICSSADQYRALISSTSTKCHISYIATAIYTTLMQTSRMARPASLERPPNNPDIHCVSN